MKMRVRVMVIDQDGLNGLQEAPMLDGIDHSSVVTEAFLNSDLWLTAGNEGILFYIQD
jgi:hypothetical protein